MFNFRNKKITKKIFIYFKCEKNPEHEDFISKNFNSNSHKNFHITFLVSFKDTHRGYWFNKSPQNTRMEN